MAKVTLTITNNDNTNLAIASRTSGVNIRVDPESTRTFDLDPNDYDSILEPLEEANTTLLSDGETYRIDYTTIDSRVARAFNDHVLYVDGDNGSDQNAGTFSDPVATISRAVELKTAYFGTRPAQIYIAKKSGNDGYLEEVFTNPATLRNCRIGGMPGSIQRQTLPSIRSTTDGEIPFVHSSMTRDAWDTFKGAGYVDYTLANTGLTYTGQSILGLDTVDADTADFIWRSEITLHDIRLEGVDNSNGNGIGALVLGAPNATAFGTLAALGRISFERVHFDSASSANTAFDLIYKNGAAVSFFDCRADDNVLIDNILAVVISSSRLWGSADGIAALGNMYLRADESIIATEGAPAESGAFGAWGAIEGWRGQMVNKLVAESDGPGATAFDNAEAQYMAIRVSGDLDLNATSLGLTGARLEKLMVGGTLTIDAASAAFARLSDVAATGGAGSLTANVDLTV